LSVKDPLEDQAITHLISNFNNMSHMLIYINVHLTNDLQARLSESGSCIRSKGDSKIVKYKIATKIKDSTQLIM